MSIKLFTNENNNSNSSHSKVESLAEVLQVSNQVSSILILLQTSEDHLSARDELLRVHKVGVQDILGPSDTRAHVSFRVAETRGGASSSAQQTEEIGTLLVGSTFLDGVALRTFGLENLSSFGSAHDAI